MTLSADIGPYETVPGGVALGWPEAWIGEVVVGRQLPASGIREGKEKSKNDEQVAVERTLSIFWFAAHFLM